MSVIRCRRCGAHLEEGLLRCAFCASVAQRRARAGKRSRARTVLALGSLLALVAVLKLLVGWAVPTPTSADVSLASGLAVYGAKQSAAPFTGVMLIGEITVANRTGRTVRDVDLECTHSGHGGAVVDRSRKTLRETIPADGSHTFRELNMGFIHAEPTRTQCVVRAARPA